MLQKHLVTVYALVYPLCMSQIKSCNSHAAVSRTTEGARVLGADTGMHMPP